jgi:hypothetical protein
VAEKGGRSKRAGRLDMLLSRDHVLSPALGAGAPEDAQLSMPARDRCVSCADRLAMLMLAVAPLTADVKTLGDWAHAAHVSVGSLRGYCGAVDIQPKRALDFARLLRVVLRSNRGDWEPTRWLAVSDLRHLRRLLARGGLLRLPGTGSPTIQTYLERQALIPFQSGTLRCVAARLAHVAVRKRAD